MVKEIEPSAGSVGLLLDCNEISFQIHTISSAVLATATPLLSHVLKHWKGLRVKAP
jgi:hypothetical protein